MKLFYTVDIIKTNNLWWRGLCAIPLSWCIFLLDVSLHLSLCPYLYMCVCILEVRSSFKDGINCCWIWQIDRFILPWLVELVLSLVRGWSTTFAFCRQPGEKRQNDVVEEAKWCLYQTVSWHFDKKNPASFSVWRFVCSYWYLFPSLICGWVSKGIEWRL